MTSAVRPHIGSDQRERIQLTIRGTVQGIGFRPFVFRLVQDLSLSGWIANTTEGALLELEGTQNHLRIFQKRVTTELPLSGNIQAMPSSSLPVIWEQSFFIRPSQWESRAQSVIFPDLATGEAVMALEFLAESKIEQTQPSSLHLSLETTPGSEEIWVADWQLPIHQQLFGTNDGEPSLGQPSITMNQLAQQHHPA